MSYLIMIQQGVIAMNRAYIVIAAGAAGAILGIAVLLNYVRSIPRYSEIILQSEQEKRDFLENCGISLKSEPPDVSYITLPLSIDSGVFGEYCQLQSKQNLPLAEHFGEEAQVWTFAESSSLTAKVQLICTNDGLLLGLIGYDSTRYDLMYRVIEQ